MSGGVRARVTVEQQDRLSTATMTNPQGRFRKLDRFQPKAVEHDHIAPQ